MPSPYLLITACKNEQAYIGRCIESVIKQTHLPVRWIINDDGSTDDTLAILKKYAEQIDFIKVRQTQRSGGRSFGAQYRAVNGAYAEYESIPHEFVSFLDSDTAFKDADYFEKLIGKFEEDPKLGVAGAYLLEPCWGGFGMADGNAPWTVAGGVQTFRRVVFEQIAGYEPLELGGSDTLAEIKARMNGWRTISFSDLLAYHFRPPSSADGQLRGLFKGGRMDASFGYHPVYAFMKFLRRLLQRPYFIGSLVRYSGYLCQVFSNQKRMVSDEVALFVRREQMDRREGLLRCLRSGRPDSRGGGVVAN